VGKGDKYGVQQSQEESCMDISLMFNIHQGMVAAARPARIKVSLIGSDIDM
jgi:hypothetical protein